ncbi:class I SAM-dependent methyltransferase [bacterium]|nr:class I SAM-dependent methyltransferase [bacterium]
MESTFHITQCPVCGQNDFKLFLEAKDWLVTKEPFSIYQCTSCTFTFTQDAPAPESVGRFYDDVNYVEHSDSDSGIIFKVYHQARKIMLKQKLSMLKKTSKGKRLMDVGSGSGYFLNHMQQNGFECLGVEISETARALCKTKFNIDALPPEDLTGGRIDKKFDLITLWHVFEHVYTYDEYFKAFDQLLDKDGKLVIAMPNYHCLEASYYKKFWNGYDVPRHLWHFDDKTFTKFASDRGFSVKKIYRLPLDPFYNSMVSAEYKPKFTFLPWTVFIGFMSFIRGLVDKSKASSLVYVLDKNI